MLTRNGSCVIAIANSSAGSSGSRRRHGEEKGSPTFPFPLSAASAAVAVMAGLLLDRPRSDVLALAERSRVLHGARDHAREELGTAVADILELWDADVLHTGQARTLRRAGIVDRCCLHRGQRLRSERGCCRLVLRDLVRREPRSRRDRSPPALRPRVGGLVVRRACRPLSV